MNIIKQIIAKFKKESEPNAELLLEYAQLQKRNKERMEAIKKSMGDKYILAECHKKGRLEVARPV